MVGREVDVGHPGHVPSQRSIKRVSIFLDSKTRYAFVIGQKYDDHQQEAHRSTSYYLEPLIVELCAI